MNEEQFKANYEFLTENVIPHSARKLKVPEKDGLGIWYFFYYQRSINIFKEKIERQDPHEDGSKKKRDKDLSPVAEFIEKAREIKITVREFKF